MDDISEEEGGATVKGGWDRSCAILHCYCKLAYIVELFFSKLSNKLSITCAWGWGGGDYWILIFLVNSPPHLFFQRTSRARFTQFGTLYFAPLLHLIAQASAEVKSCVFLLITRCSRPCFCFAGYTRHIQTVR